jgi:pimeloyl-ACP methyl ester carboxylesterase
VRAPAVVAGNSIGAVTVLSAAHATPSLVRGIVLVNAAGRFDADATPETPAAPEEPGSLKAALSDFVRRVVSAAIFYSTKYRIGQILKTVYVDHSKGACGRGRLQGACARCRASQDSRTHKCAWRDGFPYACLSRHHPHPLRSG